MVKRKRPIKRRAKAPQKRLLRKPLQKSWFQKLSNFFTKIFTAPSQTAAKRRKAKAIREIKTHGYAPSYEKRLLRAVEAGKTPSLQKVRGHAPGEAKRRAEREEAAQGITSAQIKSIRNFERRFNPTGQKEGPSAERMIEFAQQKGYKSFSAYRQRWNALRKNYISEYNKGTYSSRGEAYLDDIDYDDDEISEPPDIEWFYYH